MSTEGPHRVFEVSPEEAGQRLDRVLRARLRGLSRSALAHAIAAGQVRVSGRRVAKGALLKAGDTVELQVPETLAPQPDHALPLSVVHEDPHLLVLNKPAGMPCHPLRAGEGGTLVSAALARYPELASVGDDGREAGLVHRLDTDTSGLLLLARDGEIHRRLRALLAAGAIDKVYLARCVRDTDAPPLSPGLYHARVQADRGPRVAIHEQYGARPIETGVIDINPAADDTWLVRVAVHFASRHQVRAHLAYLGHPLVGDVLYGGPERPGGHLLHAEGMKFVHPVFGKLLSLTCTAPADFTCSLQKSLAADFTVGRLRR